MVTLWQPKHHKNFSLPKFNLTFWRKGDSDPLLKNSKTIIKALKVTGAVLLVIFLLLFFLIILPALRVKKDLDKFVSITNTIKIALKDQDLDELKTGITSSKASLSDLEASVDKHFSLYKYLPYTKEYMKDFEHIFKAGSYGMESAYIAVDNATQFADVLGFKTKEQPEIKEISNQERIFNLMKILPKYAPALDKVSVELVSMEKELNMIDPSRYPAKVKNTEIRSNIVSAQETVRQLNQKMPAIKTGLAKLPSVMGFDEPKTYMVLMANENEQRMSGGFNTYVVLMDVDEGVADLTFTIDTYDIDRDRNDLKQLVPPDFIVNLLKQNLLHARDATSISPDFPTATNFMITNFWNKNGYLPQEIDGVFQANTTVVKSLLQVLGSVNVEGRYFKTDTGSVYVEEREFTADNVFMEMERIAGEELSEVKGRKDIIKFLMNNLMFRAFNASPETLAPLIKEAVYLLESKQVILTSLDPETEKVFEDLGFAGSIKNVESNVDYLHISNSNLGAGKRDYLVTRSIDYTFEKKDGKNIGTVVMTNVNPGSPEWWKFVTFYRNYFRVYVPTGSKLISAKSLSNSKWDLNATEGVDKELNKTYFDGNFEIDQNGKFVAEYKYELPSSIDINDYKLLIQKQIGEKDTPITLNINGKKIESILVGDMYIDKTTLQYN